MWHSPSHRLGDSEGSSDEVQDVGWRWEARATRRRGSQAWAADGAGIRATCRSILNRIFRTDSSSGSQGWAPDGAGIRARMERRDRTRACQLAGHSRGAREWAVVVGVVTGSQLIYTMTSIAWSSRKRYFSSLNSQILQSINVPRLKAMSCLFFYEF